MNDIILKAIDNLSLLQVTYNGKTRVVEPHVYGVDGKGHEALLVFQVSGTRPDWRLLHTSKIRSLSLYDGSFSGPRGRGTSAQFSIVYKHV